MNTLNRASTAQFFDNPDGYAALRSHWSALMNSTRKHELSAAHHVLYLALLGKDWRRGFAPITNERKLANGAFYGWEMFRAIGALHSVLKEEWLLAPFEGLVTGRTLHLLRKLVPYPTPYLYSPQQFEGGAFPFDAYNQPDDVLTTSVGEERSRA